MIAACTCQCGSVDSLIRNYLKSIGYEGWLNIPIARGKEKSLALLNQLPPTTEKEMLQSFLKDASKWAIIIGYNSREMKWSNIARDAAKSRIEAEFVVRAFA